MGKAYLLRLVFGTDDGLNGCRILSALGCRRDPERDFSFGFGVTWRIYRIPAEDIAPVCGLLDEDGVNYSVALASPHLSPNPLSS